jgi:hypothetical protein
MPPSSHITPSGGLFTHHFIEAIQQASFSHPAVAAETFALTGVKAPTPAELERTIASAWELLTERWDSLGRGLAGMSISDLRERWMRPLLTLLDFELEYQRADLVLEGDLRFPISYLGRAVAVPGAAWIPVHTVAAGVELEAKPAGTTVRGVKGLAAHDVLQRYLNLSRTVRWGLVTNGLRLRILRDYHHSSSRGYVEFDLDGIFEERDFAAFRALYRMCHVSRFQVSGVRVQVSGENQSPELPITNPLELFYQHSQSTGVKVGDDLRKNVREAIELLANGFLGATPGLLDRLTGSREPVHYPEIGDLPPEQAFFHDILTVIYRMLFLLFAEQRGMLPGRGSLYADEFSLTALRTRAERPAGEDEHLDLWERLRTTFRMVEKGAPGLGIFGYNGALFGSDRTPTLSLTPSPSPQGGWEQESPSLAGRRVRDEGEGAGLHNSALLRAVRALTTTGQDGALQRVSYADLSVEEIGSIYESLLDFTPRITTETFRVSEDPKGLLTPGTFFLDARGSARKTTGSYYTHPSLVNQLVQSALMPVLTERLSAGLGSFDESQVEAWSESEREQAEVALLSLRVLDPAAGSGAFLISAMNTLGLTLARIRKGDFYPPEREIRRARRDVLAHCIYGVDMNPMAVELCKVSLWIDAAVDDAPLNFLDHHIRCGNSLVGATEALMAQGIPDEAYRPVSGDDKALARSARDENRRAREGQLSLWQVRESGPVYAAGEWQTLNDLGEQNPREAETLFLRLQDDADFRRCKLAADLWTAAFFWKLTPARSSDPAPASVMDSGTRPPTTADVRQAQADEQALPADLLAETQRLAKKYRFFHWELEFADVFTQNGGFDLVLSNPPWDMVEFSEQEFFESSAPEIAHAPTTRQRDQLIAALETQNPILYAEFTDAKRSVYLIRKFAQTSGRFLYSSEGRINLYPIFVELEPSLLNSQGRAGIIVPSAISMDAYNANLFGWLMQNQYVESFIDFENKYGIFPGVHRSYRFCLLTLSKKSEFDRQIHFCYLCRTVEEIRDQNKHFTFNTKDIETFSPNTFSPPILLNSVDAKLAQRIYGEFGVFMYLLKN